MFTIQLVDRSEEMCHSWESYFGKDANISIHQGDFFSLQTDCVVSPANSFGFMDGGLDSLITNKLGKIVQDKLREKLRIFYGGELLVGQAEMIETENEEIPYCLAAPTMRVPMILGDKTVNVYLAAKAAFRLLTTQYPNISKITISGLGTGVGKVPYDICARQMKQAYDEVVLNKYTIPVTWYEAQARHQNLYSDVIKDIQHY